MRITILYNPAGGVKTSVARVKATMRSLGPDSSAVGMRDARLLEDALEGRHARGADAMLVIVDPFTLRQPRSRFVRDETIR